MKNYDELKSDVLSVVKSKVNDAIKLSDWICDHPELSGEEFETSKKIVEFLSKEGYDVEYPFAGLPTAFKGVFGSNNHKYKVAIMAEYDALPEIGHACGHCLSGSISILAGLALKDLQDELDTDIHIVGTPIEETAGAKCDMVNQGVFNNYDMAIMVHLFDENLIYPNLLALDCNMYTFHGKAAHASAAPWEGVNAFNAAQLMCHGIDMLRQHVTPDVRMHGIIRDGGEAPNIVPEKVSVEFYIRASQRKYLNTLLEKIDNCAAAGALATGATWDKYATASPYDNMKPNATGEKSLTEIFGELNIPLNGDTEAIFGSSDAGNVSYVCPTFHPCIQAVESGTPIHTREFQEQMKGERAHNALGDGARLIALHICKIFGNPDNISAMKSDFNKE